MWVNAPKWKCLLARMFGQKVVTEDFETETINGVTQGIRTRTTAYQWGGNMYVTHFESEVISSHVV